MRRNFAQVAISASPGEQADIDRWLASGLVDAAFCYSPKLSENGKAISLPDDRLILVSCEKRKLMRHGGSAYLPQRLIKSQLEPGKLHQVVDAPDFFRPVTFVYVKSASDNWHWLESVLKDLIPEAMKN